MNTIQSKIFVGFIGVCSVIVLGSGAYSAYSIYKSNKAIDKANAKK